MGRGGGEGGNNGRKKNEINNYILMFDFVEKVLERAKRIF